MHGLDWTFGFYPKPNINYVNIIEIIIALSSANTNISNIMGLPCLILMVAGHPLVILMSVTNFFFHKKKNENKISR